MTQQEANRVRQETASIRRDLEVETETWLILEELEREVEKTMYIGVMGVAS